MRRGLGHVTALSIMAVSLATAAAEQDGLYKADSPVTSLASSEVPAHNSSDQRFMLVEFYSAWCGHCQHFAPTYEELARVAKQRLPSLKVAAINCPTHEDACSEHKVSSFPTILLFPGSIRYPSHSRNVEAILAWVEQQRAATPQEAAVAAKEAAAQEAAAKKAADQRLEQVKREHERLMKQFEESTKKKAEAAAGSAAAGPRGTAAAAAAESHATDQAASHATERTGLGSASLGSSSAGSRRVADPAGRRAEMLEELLGGGGGTVGGAALGSAAATALGSAATRAAGQLLDG